MVKITTLGKNLCPWRKMLPITNLLCITQYSLALLSSCFVVFSLVAFFFFFNSVQALSSQTDKILSLFYSCHLCIRLRSLQRQPQGPCIVALCSQSWPIDEQGSLVLRCASLWSYQYLLRGENQNNTWKLSFHFFWDLLLVLFWKTPLKAFLPWDILMMQWISQIWACIQQLEKIILADSWEL